MPTDIWNVLQHRYMAPPGFFHTTSSLQAAKRWYTIDYEVKLNISVRCSRTFSYVQWRKIWIEVCPNAVLGYGRMKKAESSSCSQNCAEKFGNDMQTSSIRVRNQVSR